MVKCRAASRNATRKVYGQRSLYSQSDAKSYRLFTAKAKRVGMGGGFFYSARLLSPPEEVKTLSKHSNRKRNSRKAGRRWQRPCLKTFQPKGFTDPTASLVNYHIENPLFRLSYLLYLKKELRPQTAPFKTLVIEKKALSSSRPMKH